MPHPVKDVRVLSRITTEAFNQRRKTIRNSLGNLFSVEVLTGMGDRPGDASGKYLCRAILPDGELSGGERAFAGELTMINSPPSVYSGSKRLH